MPNHRAAFESQLLTTYADVSLIGSGFEDIPWSEFVLNPRRLRGSDFLMRWSQGVWSELRVIQAINETGRFRAFPYGPSGVAPDDDPRQFELYFERLEKAGLGGLKRPDLLVVRESDAATANRIIAGLGGDAELPFAPESHLAPLLKLGVAAIECENSLWKAGRMPAFGKPLTTQRRTGKIGAPKSAVLPTVIIKEEDWEPLLGWERQNGLPIHVWQVFFDRAYGISLQDARRLVNEGIIEPTAQVYQAPGGATTRKNIYKIYYQFGYEVGLSSSEPTLVAASIEDKNGHILPYVRFDGGALHLTEGVLRVLDGGSGR